MYRVLYKKWSQIENAAILVEDTIDASGFNVTDVGALVFYGGDEGVDTRLKPILAIPPGLWFFVDEEPKPFGRITVDPPSDSADAGKSIVFP